MKNTFSEQFGAVYNLQLFQIFFQVKVLVQILNIPI